MNTFFRVDDIITWAIDDNPNKRLTFAHIEGPQASAKAIKLPKQILDSRRILDHRRTLIVQILPEFKRNAVTEAQGSWSPNLRLEEGQHQPELTVETYRDPYENISEFLLTKSKPAPAQPVVLKDMPLDLLRYGTVSNDSGSLCLRFRDAKHDAEDKDEQNTVPSQWDPWSTIGTTKWNYACIPAALKKPGVSLKMLHLNANSRTAELLPSYYTVSIFASPTVGQLIFDRRSHQLLHTFLWISKSEELQQLSWRLRVQSYHPPDVLCLDHFEQHRATERRMKICNEHAEGFMAALLDYTAWPCTMFDLLRIVRKKDDVFEHVLDRFIFQGLVVNEEDRPRLPRRLVYPDAFYALLPQVNYDSRVAQFLTLETTPLMTMIKVHLAPMLAAANEPMELLHVPGLDSGIKTAIQECMKECSRVCDAGPWVRRSTLWATAGLGSMIDADADDEDEPNLRATTPLADGNVRVLTVACTQLSEFDAIREQVNEQNYKRISRDLLYAYSHQVAFASRPRKKLKEGESPKLYDFMTKRLFQPNLNLAVIDWDYLFSQEKKVFGVYTHLKRLEDGGTTVCNWTWIPGGCSLLIIKSRCGGMQVIVKVTVELEVTPKSPHFKVRSLLAPLARVCGLLNLESVHKNSP
ncbi:hypothetical protein F52700_6297 [Fusarium sp. NRRL 52700]|nr:hypothetical protein F52700_6297 [Fusarium sp. NRRL 52700]